MHPTLITKCKHLVPCFKFGDIKTWSLIFQKLQVLEMKIIVNKSTHFTYLHTEQIQDLHLMITECKKVTKHGTIDECTCTFRLFPYPYIHYIHSFMQHQFHVLSLSVKHFLSNLKLSIYLSKVNQEDSTSSEERRASAGDLRPRPSSWFGRRSNWILGQVQHSDWSPCGLKSLLQTWCIFHCIKLVDRKLLYGIPD